MNLFPKMPHQNIGLRTFFLTQVNTVDLSPIEHYNFRWGPNFVESPCSLVHMLDDLPPTITCCSNEPLPPDASPEHLRPYVLSDSGQHCVDLSSIKNYNFGWGPNFVESPSSLVYMLYDLQQTITCCSDEPLPQDASPEHWPPYVLSDSGQRCRFEPHRKL